MKELEQLREIIHPKQFAIRYKIANPMGSYWNIDKEGESINKSDADILRNSDKTVKKLTEFLDRSFKARESVAENNDTNY